MRSTAENASSRVLGAELDEKVTWKRLLSLRRHGVAVKSVQREDGRPRLSSYNNLHAATRSRREKFLSLSLGVAYTVSGYEMDTGCGEVLMPDQYAVVHPEIDNDVQFEV